MTVRYLVLLLAAASAYGATPACTTETIKPGGDAVVTRFIAAPLPRVHDAVADAMQAAGVFLFKNADESLEGPRTGERVTALRLAPGDEAVRAELTTHTEEGKAGTQIRVETLRRDNKKGPPKQAWSTAVLDEAACLVSLLSLDDPLHRPKLPAASGAEIGIGDSTSLLVRSRHFFFNTDAKPNHVIPFETAEDVAIDGSTVIPAGALVAALLEDIKDVGEFGRGAKGQLRFKYLVLPDGTRVPLRGVVDLKGMNRGKGDLIGTGVAVGVIEGAPLGVGAVAAETGFGFAVPAGTLFQVKVDGRQSIRVSRPVSGTP